MLGPTIVRFFAGIFAVAIAWNCWQAVSTGTTVFGRSRTPIPIERATNPSGFWTAVIVKAAIVIALAWIAVY